MSKIEYGFNSLTNTITHISVNKKELITDVPMSDFKEARRLMKIIDLIYFEGRKDALEQVGSHINLIK